MRSNSEDEDENEEENDGGNDDENDIYWRTWISREASERAQVSAARIVSRLG